MCLRSILTTIFITTLAVSSAVAERMHGEWEGQILSSRRPMVLYVNFEENKARLDIAGSQDLPVQLEVIEGSQVSFVITTQDQKIRFVGTMIGGQLAGTASLDRTVPFALERLPAHTPPRSREEAWQQDIDAVLHRFLKYDRSFSEEARKKATTLLRELQHSAAEKTDEELIAGLSRAIAFSNNAHTRLYLLRNRTELRRYPVRVWWFNNGLHVIKTTREHQDLLGCEVTGIGKHDPLSVREKVSDLFAGNEAWTDYKSVYYMTSPEILRGLDLISNMEQTEFEFRCDGRSKIKPLAPLKLARKEMPTEAWWDLTPFWQETEENWVHALDDKKSKIPMYLHNPGQHYWFEYLKPQRALYFQYNRSQNMQSGETLSQFGERVVAELNRHRTQKLIVDLRFNTGGNLDFAKSLMEELKKIVEEKGIRTFVLIGRATFSAGISHAAQWSSTPGVTFIGEGPGDVLDFFSEGGNLILPNSKLAAHYANGFHAYSKRQFPEFQPYFLDMNVEAVQPHMVVSISSKDYFSGVDPVLDAALRSATIRK